MTQEMGPEKGVFLQTRYGKIDMSKIITSLVLLLAPLLVVVISCPSQNKIVSEKAIKCSSVKDEKGKTIDPYLIWGDIFTPSLSGVRGWDIVGIPMYFDPITVGKSKRIIDTPVFHNALVHSTSTEKEFKYTYSNLVKAAIDNSDQLICLTDNEKSQKTCEGDQINPYIWPSYPGSKIYKENHIRFMAALPVFDPNSLLKLLSKSISTNTSKTSEIEHSTRKTLESNVEYITDSIISRATNEEKVNSLAVPIIGSTSHKGGDSKLFLNFYQGMKSIYRGLKRSDSGYTFSKFYLVGFHLHTGVYKQEALQALQNFWIMTFIDHFSSKYKWVLVSYFSIVFFIYLLMYYKNYAQNFKNKNVSRINLFATGSGISIFFSTIATGACLLLIPNISVSNISLNYAIVLSALLTIFISFLYLTKQILKP